MWNDKNDCLSIDETLEWCKLLEVDFVPIIYKGLFNKNIIENLHRETYEGNECEGFVLRNCESFHYSKFRNNVGKFVRENHVMTNKHWIKQEIIKNKLKQIL